jgi:hypothetical protein
VPAGWVLNLFVLMLFVGELARFVAGEIGEEEWQTDCSIVF